VSPRRLTSVDVVREVGSFLFTVTDPRGDPVEVTLVPCEDGVTAWLNTCTHEAQRLDRGGDVGAVVREGQIVCPRHGSLFDACDGRCDNGPAAGSQLVAVDITVNRGDVFLTDETYEFEHAGGLDAGDGLPDSTSHLRF
jgi:nitrite reductase/ring-hydroxylating ferredoxin subunit